MSTSFGSAGSNSNNNSSGGGITKDVSVGKSNAAAEAETDDVWVCAVCGKLKPLSGPHLRGRDSVRSDCWPCGRKQFFLRRPRRTDGQETSAGADLSLDISGASPLAASGFYGSDTTDSRSKGAINAKNVFGVATSWGGAGPGNASGVAANSIGSHNINNNNNSSSRTGAAEMLTPMSSEMKPSTFTFPFLSGGAAAASSAPRSARAAADSSSVRILDSSSNNNNNSSSVSGFGPKATAPWSAPAAELKTSQTSPTSFASYFPASTKSGTSTGGGGGLAPPPPPATITSAEAVQALPSEGVPSVNAANSNSGSAGGSSKGTPVVKESSLTRERGGDSPAGGVGTRGREAPLFHSSSSPGHANPSVRGRSPIVMEAAAAGSSPPFKFTLPPPDVSAQPARDTAADLDNMELPATTEAVAEDEEATPGAAAAVAAGEVVASKKGAASARVSGTPPLAPLPTPFGRPGGGVGDSGAGFQRFPGARSNRSGNFVVPAIPAEDHSAGGSTAARAEGDGGNGGASRGGHHVSPPTQQQQRTGSQPPNDHLNRHATSDRAALPTPFYIDVNALPSVGTRSASEPNISSVRNSSRSANDDQQIGEALVDCYARGVLSHFQREYIMPSLQRPRADGNGGGDHSSVYNSSQLLFSSRAENGSADLLYVIIPPHAAAPQLQQQQQQQQQQQRRRQAHHSGACGGNSHAKRDGKLASPCENRDGDNTGGHFEHCRGEIDALASFGAFFLHLQQTEQHIRRALACGSDGIPSGNASAGKRKKKKGGAGRGGTALHVFCPDETLFASLCLFKEVFSTPSPHDSNDSAANGSSRTLFDVYGPSIDPTVPPTFFGRVTQKYSAPFFGPAAASSSSPSFSSPAGGRQFGSNNGGRSPDADTDRRNFQMVVSQENKMRSVTSVYRRTRLLLEPHLLTAAAMEFQKGRPLANPTNSSNKRNAGDNRSNNNANRNSACANASGAGPASSNNKQQQRQVSQSSDEGVLNVVFIIAEPVRMDRLGYLTAQMTEK